jgi:hypothetical protein
MTRNCIGTTPVEMQTMIRMVVFFMKKLGVEPEVVEKVIISPWLLSQRYEYVYA